MGFEKNPFKRKYTDKDGNPIDKHGNKIDVEEYDVPMYRAYGVHKVHRPWLNKLKDCLVTACVILLLSPIIAAVGIVVFTAAQYSGVYTYAAFIFIFALSVVLYFFYISVLRMPLRRSRYYSKIKRACRKNNYTVTFDRGALGSLRWAEDSTVDFTVRAGEWIYYVKMFGCKKRSDVTFCQSGELIYKKYPKGSLLSKAMDFKPKTVEKKIVFPAVPESEKQINAIILDPIPMEMYKKRLNKDIEMTGNDDEVFGYTVFTGKGFFEVMRRNIDGDVFKQDNKRH